MDQVWLKPGRDKSVRNRHPWVFSGAVERVEGAPRGGDVVAVCDHEGKHIATGYYNERSQISVRVLSWQPGEAVDASWWRHALMASIARREALAMSADTDAYRLVNAESDGLPGLVVDRYGDWLVLQALTLGVERWKATLAGLLTELLGPRGVYERSDADVRKHEGLGPATGCLAGETPPERLLISEDGLRFAVDVLHGDKTGFYLDQRNNRARVGALAAGREVLNCFCYTGGFSLYALSGGANSVLSVDSSAEALALGAANLARNPVFAGTAEWLCGDVFQLLRKFRDQARQFDLIILDPPKFAPTAAQAPAAARGYKDINRLGFKLLRPGGLLATFSCSGGVSAELFQKIVADAALDAGVSAQILEHLHAGADHPIALNFPEGEYLKGLICRVD